MVNLNGQYSHIGKATSPGAVTVTNSSTEILAANTNRKWCFITNVGNRDAYFAIGKTAEINKGIFLSKSGGSILMDGTVLSVEALNGITVSGTTAVIYQEAI